MRILLRINQDGVVQLPESCMREAGIQPLDEVQIVEGEDGQLMIRKWSAAEETLVSVAEEELLYGTAEGLERSKA